MHSGATATFVDKAIDTLSIRLSMVLNNNYPYTLNLDQPLASIPCLKILRINYIGIELPSRRRICGNTNFILYMRVAHNGSPPMHSHLRA